MRVLSKILGIVTLGLFLANNAFGFLAVVNIDGNSIPTLYYFAGEKIGDIYERSGALVSSLYRDFDNSWRTVSKGDSINARDTYKVYYKGTYYTVSRFVNVKLSASVEFGSVEHLNSEVRFLDYSANASQYFGLGDLGLGGYRAYFADRAYIPVTPANMTIGVSHVVLPDKFTRPICNDYYSYTEGKNDHLIGVECSVVDGQKKPSTEEIATLLAQSWSLVWAPVGSDPESVGLNIQAIDYEIVTAFENSKESYSNDTQSYVSIKVSASELNKIIEQISDNSAFVIYGLINLNNGKIAVDNRFLSNVNWFYTHKNADSFSTVGVWVGDRLYSSDFLLTCRLEDIDMSGANTNKRASYSGGSYDGIKYSAITNDVDNYVEFLDPCSGSVLKTCSFKELDEGKVIGSPFSNIQVPAADYSVFAGYDMQDLKLDTYRKNRVAQIILDKKLKGYANFQVKNKHGSILSSGTINVNDFLYALYGSTLAESDAFGSFKLKWSKAGDTGQTLAFDVANINSSKGTPEPYIECAFGLSQFSDKYELLWDITRDGKRLDCEKKYGVSYRKSKSSSDTRICLFEQNFYTGGDGSQLNLFEAKEFSNATLSLSLYRKDVTCENSGYLDQCDKFMSEIHGLSSFTAIFKSMDFSDPSLFKEEVIGKNEKGEDTVLGHIGYDFADFNGKAFNLLGEDVSDQLVTPYGTARSIDAFRTSVTWEKYTYYSQEWDYNGNELNYKSSEYFDNTFQDMVLSRSYGFSEYFTPANLYYEGQPEYRNYNEYGNKRWVYSKYSGYESEGDHVVSPVPEPLSALDSVDENNPSESIRLLRQAIDYSIIHNTIASGVFNINHWPVGTMMVVPCPLHNGCLAKFFCATNINDSCVFDWSVERIRSDMLEDWEIDQGRLQRFTATVPSSDIGTVDNGDVPWARYFIGCQKSGCVVDDNADWTALRSLSFAPQVVKPFKIEFSWPIPEFTIDKRVFGSVGFCDNYAGWVFEQESALNFLYENLTISGESYMLPAVCKGNWIPSGGGIYGSFRNYMELGVSMQVTGRGPYYDELLADVIPSDSDHEGSHCPASLYAYLGPLQYKTTEGSCVLGDFANREDSIMNTEYVDRTTLSNMGFWNIKTEGFKQTGLWSLAFGSAWSRYKFNVYVPIYVNGFKRDIFFPSDLARHPNLAAVTNSNSDSPDTYELTAQESGQYTLNDMLVFATYAYHPDVYKVRWLAHYVDDSGNAHTVTMKKAQELFGVKYTEGALSKLIKLQLDCSEVSPDVDIQKIRFQPVIYKTTQLYYRGNKGDGFEIWEVDDSDPYWVPSNTDVKRLGGGEPRNATVIASVGNFWGVTIKSTTTAKTKDMVVWDFVRDPAIYSKSAKWFIGKIDSKLSNATVSTTGWGTSNCTYSIKKANGAEAYTGKVSFLANTGTPTGNLNENTYGWTFNQEIPDYLASDLAVFYMDESIGGKATFKLDPNNKKKILLQGLQDSQFRTASAAVIAKLTTEGYESLAGVWVGAPIPYTTNLGAPLYPAGEEALFDAPNYKNGWSVPVKLSGIFRWDGDSAPTDGSTVKDSSGNTVTPGSKLTPGEYTVIKDGEEHAMYVNGVARKNERNVYLKSGDNTPELAFTFKYPVQLNSDGSFLWYGIQGEFGLRNPISGAFNAFKGAYNGMEAPWNTYFTDKGSCTGFTDSATEASFVFKGAKANVDGMEFGAKVGGEYSESYSIFVQPDAVIQIKLEKVE